MKITVVGTGYVGLVTGVCFSEMGNDVTCVDIDKEKVEELKKANSPIYEPGIEELIVRNVEHERLFFTTDLSSCLSGSSCVFIAVGTPEGEDGSADLKYVLGVADEIAEEMTHPITIIVKSTVPVGTCNLVEKNVSKKLKELGKNIEFTVASNPEFLKEGAAISDFMTPDRVVCGVTSVKDEKLFKELYQPFIMNDPSRLLFMDRRSSELTKYASNAMLATRISFMNELSQLVDVVGGNIDSIRRGMGMDPRIGKKFLYAGPGYGGSCFPKDVEALAKTAARNDVELKIVNAVRGANESQKEYGARKVAKILGQDLSGKKVAVWGLSFKPKTDDVRETPALNIVNKLLELGAEVACHDPEAIDTFKKLIGVRENVSYETENYHKTLEGASALVLVTEWLEYRRPNWDKVSLVMKDKVVVDLRNQYSRTDLENRGFVYDCIGRP